jgi:deoxyribose-phosphate aldolase
MLERRGRNMKINRYLDHSVLIPSMTKQEAREAIQLGLDYGVKGVCVRPCDLALAVDMCAGTQTIVCCVLDFPHGTGGAAAKESLAMHYVEQGVREIDMVMDYSAALSGEWDVVEDGIKRVVQVARPKGVGVKVIFETCELTMEQIKKAAEISIEAGADYIKTSTGFAGGVTDEAVKCMLDAAKGRIKVKVSGGVLDLETAKKYIGMGAERLGVKYSTTPILLGDCTKCNCKKV